jgi:hypothetical protein
MGLVLTVFIGLRLDRMSLSKAADVVFDRRNRDGFPRKARSLGPAESMLYSYPDQRFAKRSGEVRHDQGQPP